jgi:DNA-binding transcriptional regulator YiaG
MIHYRGAGLDNVYLVNGYTTHAMASGEEAISIHNLEGLHKAIASALASQVGEMDGQTFRFLRKYIDMGQRAIGGILGATENTVSNWERGQCKVPGASAELLRGVVREHVSGNASLIHAVNAYNQLDRELRKQEFSFEESNGQWGLAA